MKSYLVKSTGDLNFIRVNEADHFKEVCIEVKFPKEVEEEFELSNYDISVRFHDESEIDVFVYDNEEDSTRNFQFTSKIKNELIEFAKSYIN